MAECCGGSNVLIYSCAGESDVGELSDKAARKLREMGLGKMTCIAGVGADISGFVESAKGSDRNIALDGCGIACVKKMLDKIGAASASYILTEIGYVKGKTPVSEKVVSEIAGIIMKAEGKAIAPKKEDKAGGCSCGGKC